MNRFNLTFSGEIQTGLEPEDVKLRFAEKFAIDDTGRLEQFFTGKTIILRRNLDRKDAAQCFREMHQIGVVAELVKLTAEETAAALTGNPESNDTADAAPTRDGLLGRVKKSARKSEKKSDKRTKIHAATKAKKSKSDKAAVDGSPSKITSAADSLNPGLPAQTPRDTQTQAIAAKEAEALRSAEREAAELRAEREKDQLEKKQLEEKAKAREAKEAETLRKARQEAEELRAERKKKLQEKEQFEAKAKASEAEALRKTEHETAQLQAGRDKELHGKEQREVEIRARQAEEAQAQRQAEEQRQAALAAEQQVQQQREQQEKKRLKAEQAARRKAEKAQARAEKEKVIAQQALARAEEQAEQKLQAEEQKHLAAIAAAQLEAKREEQLRHEAEQQARVAAEQENQKIQQAKKAQADAAEKARRVAQTEVDRKQAEDEKARLALIAQEQEVARQQAVADAARQAEREEAALKRADQEQQRAQAERELAEKARRETAALAERNATLEKEHAIAAEKAARLQAELAIQQRREKERVQQSEKERAERLAQEKAALEEAQNHQEQLAAAQKLALEAEDAAAQAALENGPVVKAASALAASTALKPARASARTALDLPQRHSGPSAVPTRKRQAGEPNLYTLRPFRNTPAVRSRATQATRAARRYAIAGAIALAALLALSAAYLRYTPAPLIHGIDTLATSEDGQLLLITADTLFLHDRSGTATSTLAISTLGLDAIRPPLAYDNDGALLLTGRVHGESGTQLLRCDLNLHSCTALPELPAEVQIAAFVVTPLNGQLLLLDTSAGELIKTDSEGRILARATVTVPSQPHVTIDAGLLMLNSTQGPAISVLRYDDSAFGQQLDEILLLPPIAAKAGHSSVGGFVQTAQKWWVTLFNPDNGSAAIYRVDKQWNYIDHTSLAANPSSMQIVNWGEKTLVNNPSTSEILRFNSQGVPELAFRSQQLETAIKEREHSARLGDSIWRVGLLTCGLLSLLALATAFHQNLRHRVYKSGKVRGADPIDDFTDVIQWVEHFPGRQGALRARIVSYCVAAAALLLLAGAQQASALQIAALMLMLSGPAIALLLYARSSPGHLGVLNSELVLVEPAGMYHMGNGGNILFRGGFLFMDDVVVFMGNKLLPAFSTAQLQALVLPVVRGSIRVDRNTLLVRLLQSGHPLARGGFTILLCALAAIILLAVESFF